MPLPAEFVYKVTEGLKKVGVDKKQLINELQGKSDDEIDSFFVRAAQSKKLQIPIPTEIVQKLSGMPSLITEPIKPGEKVNLQASMMPGSPPGPVEAFAQSTVSSATFGLGRLMPEQRIKAEELSQQFPISSALGTLAGTLIGPAKVGRVAELLFNAPRIIKGISVAKQFKDLAAPVLDVVSKTPSLGSEMLTAFALSKAEGLDTTSAIAASGLVGGVGVLFKGLSAGVRSAEQASTINPQVKELVESFRNNPERYQQIKKAVLAGDASVLENTLKEADKVVSGAKLEMINEKMQAGRALFGWMDKTRKVLNQDFRTASQQFLKKNVGNNVEISKLTDKIEGVLSTLGVFKEGKIVADASQRLLAKNIDDTILDIYSGLIKGGRADGISPKLLPVQDLLDLRKTIQTASKFNRMASEKTGVNAEVFGFIRQEIADQLPEYSKILEKYAKSRSSLEEVAKFFKPLGKQSPADVIDSVFTNPQKEANVNQLFDQLYDQIEGNRESLTTALKGGVSRMSSLGREAATFRKIAKEFPKDPKTLRSMFLKTGLETLDDTSFQAFTKMHPVLETARKEARTFIINSQIFGSLNNLLDEASNIILRPAVGAAGAIKGSTMQRLAASDAGLKAQVWLKTQDEKFIAPIQNMIDKLGKNASPLEKQFIKTLAPTWKDFLQLLPKILVDPEIYNKAKMAIAQGNQFFNTQQSPSEGE